MAEIWKPQPIEVYREWVDEVITEGQEELNEWESEFVESIYERLFVFNKNLSELQAKKLDDIYTKHTK